ncbi:hypothetical protein DSO57_1008874 [Entomophthora muscae]|uniref:Uncharacterized protein n=1 Tax=Entomophthora muscae TaxID=34485 RepID=A0ACC2RY53_9FUNG|nr:hypothetical protein DSO57_1008874 [Entomophthora muscae]
MTLSLTSQPDHLTEPATTDGTMSASCLEYFTSLSQAWWTLWCQILVPGPYLVSAYIVVGTSHWPGHLQGRINQSCEHQVKHSQESTTLASGIGSGWCFMVGLGVGVVRKRLDTYCVTEMPWENSTVSQNPNASFMTLLAALDNELWLLKV